MIHRISEPQRFWTAARQATLPEGVVLHLTLPTADAVREFVDGLAAGSSDNEYLEIDEANARGL